jgi:tRNA (adenine37-N6)-methyltransferase
VLIIDCLQKCFILLSMKPHIHPVAVVENDILQNHRFGAAEVVSQIVVAPRYRRALDGLDAFSHVVVVFWLHEIKNKERSTLEVHPRRDPSIPLKGVFATRSPVRPNPIGITSVRLLGIKDNVLTVKGLDAINGTPVLDIKPYIPENFPQSDITLAEWSKK